MSVSVSVVVCTRLKVVRSAGWTGVTFYLTNTVYTQVYCTGNPPPPPLSSSPTTGLLCSDDLSDLLADPQAWATTRG